MRRRTLTAGPRLEAIAELVPPGSRVADVGTDHAKLPLALLADGRALACIATERTAARLTKARAAAESAGRPHALELRFGEGLAPLHPVDRLDVLVVSGVGGHAIRDILSTPRLRLLDIRRLVLQPTVDAAVVRRWLGTNGWRIGDERCAVERGRFHEIIAAERGTGVATHPLLSEEDLHEAGPVLVRLPSPALVDHWQGWLIRHEAILSRSSPGRSRDEALRQRDLARRVLAALAGAMAGGGIE